jgi:hypothetical protein
MDEIFPQATGHNDVAEADAAGRQIPKPESDT